MIWIIVWKIIRFGLEFLTGFPQSGLRLRLCLIYLSIGLTFEVSSIQFINIMAWSTCDYIPAKCSRMSCVPDKKSELLSL